MRDMVEVLLFLLAVMFVLLFLLYIGTPIIIPILERINAK